MTIDVKEEDVGMLTHLGISKERSEAALREMGGDVNKAADWPLPVSLLCPLTRLWPPRPPFRSSAFLSSFTNFVIE
ncbi:hypothetical protein CALVIDRAFT_90753 [Calocera viscosa TUFC12733]|uniref:UBA domain-containing protein n=1 Tax=Calocera viscosa (strain TUFC12733) TaxID=1330018 RepID=A0A167MSG0_CALVF|nr:hypothetical protein CALVIDRAFT_90753 [Calocera viscosa TUFC12733]